MISSFMERAREDPRIGPLHISVYMAILYCRAAQGFGDGVEVSARRLMPLAKIRGMGPYHRSIRQLHEYGYIQYEPSNDPRVWSRVRVGVVHKMCKSVSKSKG